MPREVEKDLVCIKCGNSSRAADGSCNSIARHGRRGIPIYCRSKVFIRREDWRPNPLSPGTTFEEF